MRLLPRPAADDRLAKTEVLVMWLVVAVAIGLVFWSKLDDAVVSTDNVMRLVEVRALLNGAPWFNPTRHASPRRSVTIAIGRG